MGKGKRGDAAAMHQERTARREGWSSQAQSSAQRAAQPEAAGRLRSPQAPPSRCALTRALDALPHYTPGRGGYGPRLFDFVSPATAQYLHKYLFNAGTFKMTP